MKSLLELLALTVFLTPVSLRAQTQWVSSDVFPAALEFKEIKAVQAEKEIRTPAGLAKLEHGAVLAEAGLARYDERSYALADGGSLLIAVYSFPDARNSYSVLSLLGKPPIQAGPPGDFFVSEGGTLSFIAGNRYVSIRPAGASDLARRIAVSIANRVANPTPKRPSLIRHVPAQACDPASARYFMGPRALELFGAPVAGRPLSVPSDVEVAQARCSSQEQSGTFTLLSFPTIQIAEEYFNAAPIYASGNRGNAKLYTRQTGPLVGIMEGNFEPDVADKILGSLQFTYSVKWIYDKNKPTRTIWGVPVRILGTVVRSILFTALLCAASIIAGIMLAAGRIYARRRWPRIEEYENYIRLKIDEN